MKLRFLTLCKHVHPGIVLAEPCYGLLPELKRHLTCHVATEAVNPLLHPEAHRVGHSLPYILVFVIEVGCVGPVCCVCSLAFFVAFIPLRSTLCRPYRIRRSVVGNTIDHDLEAEPVSFSKEVLEVFHCAELRIDGLIVPDCVVRTETALAAFHSDRMDRHEPEDVYSKVLETGQLLLSCCECALRGVLAHIHFIDH